MGELDEHYDKMIATRLQRAELCGMKNPDEVLPANDISDEAPVLVFKDIKGEDMAKDYVENHEPPQDGWEWPLVEQLKHFNFSRLEFPREDDGCPGVYVKAEGTYNEQSFKVYINTEHEGSEEYEGPEGFRKEVIEFFWGGDFTTQLLWT